MSADMIDANVYLQVVRDRRYPYQARVVRQSRRRPTALVAGAVTVKLTVRTPRAAFEPLRPEAVVVVPEDLVQLPVEVEATEP